MEDGDKKKSEKTKCFGERYMVTEKKKWVDFQENEKRYRSRRNWKMVLHWGR